MAVDIKSQKPILSNVTGGLSGPAIKPVGLSMVYKVFKEVKLPLVGIGGIMNATDAIEYTLLWRDGVYRLICRPTLRGKGGRRYRRILCEEHGSATSTTLWGPPTKYRYSRLKLFVKETHNNNELMHGSGTC